MAEKEKFNIAKETAWCPGCGNYGILRALARALENLGLRPQEVLFVSGIGQAGKTPHYISGNVLNTLHGRTLPTATGAKIANNELTVIAIGGDGDGYAEGGNHFIHAVRKNVDLTYIVHDNRVFGLTKGQASPSSDLGMITGTTPHGVYNEPFNPLAVAISLNGAFVARAFAGDQEHLQLILQEAITHPGFALIDVLQPCVTFNRVNTYQWYKSRIYDINQDPEYDPSNQKMAWERSWEWGERIPIGVFYRVKRPTLLEHIPALRSGPLVKQPMNSNIDEVLAQFK